MILLSFDARSFAPFAFSPVAFAIQELIEEIQRREEYHGGGGRRVRAQAQARPRSSALQALTEDEVRAQWELLELRQRNQAEQERRAQQAASQTTAQPAKRVARAAAPAAAPAAQPAASTPPSAVGAEQANAMQRDDDALALLLLLSEV